MSVFWDDKFDLTHTGEIEIEPMSEEERQKFFSRYTELPHPFSQLMG